MTLTKDKLVTRLQTQIDMTKPEYRQIVDIDIEKAVIEKFELNKIQYSV